MILSTKQKNMLDRVAWFLGTVGGYLSSNTLGLSMTDQALASFGGLMLGDVASDLVGLAAGTLTTATVEQQAQQAITAPVAAAAIQAQIAKLPAANQATANTLLTLLQTELAKTA